MWRDRDLRLPVMIFSLVFGALVTGVLLLGTPKNFDVVFKYGEHSFDTGLDAYHLIGLYVAFLLASLAYFVPRFAAAADRTSVDAFYENLDTPVDVATEASGSSEAAISVFRLVGVLTFLIAGLVAVLGILELILEPERSAGWWKYGALVAILAFLGGLFLLAVRRTSHAADA